MLFLRVITTIPMLFVNFNIERNRWKSVTEERFTEKKVIEAKRKIQKMLLFDITHKNDSFKVEIKVSDKILSNMIEFI